MQPQSRSRTPPPSGRRKRVLLPGWWALPSRAWNHPEEGGLVRQAVNKGQSGSEDWNCHLETASLLMTRLTSCREPSFPGSPLRRGTGGSFKAPFCPGWAGTQRRKKPLLPYGTGMSAGCHGAARVEGGLGECVLLLCTLVSDSLWPQGLQPARLLCPWAYPGKSTRVGCHALLQRVFPPQGWNPNLLHWQADFTAEPPGKPLGENGY